MSWLQRRITLGPFRRGFHLVTRQIVDAQAIIRKYREGNTPVALVKSAYRHMESVVLTDLDNFLEYEIGM